LHISASAESDLAEAREWYKRIRPGLEIDLELCIEAATQRILENPLAFPEILPNVHKAIIKRFPYAVIFRIRKNHIEIEAFFHGKRKPGSWIGVLKN